MSHLTLRSTACALFGLIAAGALGAAPLYAQGNGNGGNGNTPPGNPCGNGPGVGTGNPCGGNNGNNGAQGNSGNGANDDGEVVEIEEGGFRTVSRPARNDTGVFISQVGSGNVAGVEQQNAASYALVAQSGSNNTATLDQRDNGNHYAEVAQDGNDNVLTAAQVADGDTVLLFAQRGDRNTAAVVQGEAGTGYSAAEIMQDGLNNELSLIQNGSDNQARLTQSGDGNAMSATQLSSGNRLEWSQIGNDLSDLNITQGGGQTMVITQTNGGG
ncbi:hypothetical protein [Erythrobacter sp.]|jgi:hypothetical protein|uniref:hypothetical protein n=1 Tax=Erythrobacter sp. TaxID=1042 RepID=UPI002EC1F6D5|nr:hypothetical protein [Erythrobacter sp.]